MKNFWSQLKKPIYVLAPMAGVADSAFRQICKSFGADVVYSEMISATAVVYDSKKTFELMEFSKKERPFVVQLFGSKPEHFAKAAKIVEKKIKPDGIDINFGCPVKKVARQGAGAVLMNDFKLAREIVAAVINNTSLPVSIKIRSCVGSSKALDFLKYLADLDIKAVMIHGRSAAQGNSGEIDWKMIKQARLFVKGVLLANGGIKTAADADGLLKKTGADGVGIGQGALGKPWIFEQLKIKRQSDIQDGQINKIPLTPFVKGGKQREDIFKIMLRHAKLAEKLKGNQACPQRSRLRGGRGIIEMRKHLCWYVSGLPDASFLRRGLIKVESVKEIKKILNAPLIKGD